jgi:Acetyltransferase (GNAT) domain
VALPDRLQHIWHEDEIPAEVACSLENIYQSPFCVTEYFEIFRGVHSLNAMVITCGEPAPRHVLAYVVSGRQVTVLNELVEIGQDYVQYFTAAVFDRYPKVSTVNFNCLAGRPVDFQLPWRRWKISQDIAIELPRCFDEYRSKLGKQTQKHLKYYVSRLQREFGEFAFHVAATQEIDPTMIGRIIEMNRMRMKGKSIRSGYNGISETKIMEFCRHYGLVCTVSIDGKTVAGAICYEVGNQAYLEAISHDPGYNKYNVGQVCLYLTVKHLIEKGRDSFHLLWGENEYKYRFLGVKQDLYFISMYRSYAYKVLSIPQLAKHTCSYILRQLDYLAKKYIIKRFRQRSCR